MTDREVVHCVAPKGVLRVALNYGNRVLVDRGAGGRPQGISVEIAGLLSDWLSVDMSFVDYHRAADVSDAAAQDLWDVCFLAVDPERAKLITFTDPYVRIDGCYLVPARCSARDASELFSSSVKVGSVEGSAYSLTLQRKPGARNLRIYPDMATMFAALDNGEVDAVAGIGDVMQIKAAQRVGARVLHPSFMDIRQALGVPKGRFIAAAALKDFVRDLSRADMIGDILERHGVSRTCALL
ncbi:MAG: amino acid ABC transporter substrate-binding protein [Oceanibulbus sp.]|uniref:transporter substrate-binding domain-containing protein n=1 Tax=Sulfitobacter dubius TaxID=218673 RepID=UPI000C6941F4|nr:amino acid ABC transporter substrate-binding protein [Sulfitobacter sp.]